MDTSEFREIFAAEARDYLQSLNENLLQLEQRPNDRRILDDMFRAAHSLKGMAATMGFQELASLTHEMESVLDLMRTSRLAVEQRVVDVLFRSVDALEELLESTLAGTSAAISTHLIQQLRQLTDTAPGAQAEVQVETDRGFRLDAFDLDTINQAGAQGLKAYAVHITLRPNTLLKSVRVFTIFQALETIGTIIKSYPPAHDLEDERFDLDFSLLVLTAEQSSSVQQLVEGISEIDAVEVEEVRVSQGQARSEAAAALEPSSGSSDFLKAAQVQQRGSDKYVRIETERLDKLINLVGELVISRTQVMEMVKDLNDSDQKSVVGQLDRVTTELQHAAMNLRMVPIRHVFHRFPRMVRDLARASKKEINLEIYGEETELDRSLVNQIGDPLVHLIRNSIDHGIEEPKVRIARGKPEVGTIRLSARHEGSHILIEVEDDGGGLDVEKVRAKAVERGLIASDKANLTLEEAVDLLFQPGFSTAGTVTDISGRGVGLDAVKAVVESLSGTIEVESVPERYLRTIIKLPLTLAIIKALLVVADGETYAVPIQAVRENLQITRSQIKTVQQHSVIVLRNEVLPLYDLAECLGFSPVMTDTSEDSLSVIVMETRGQKAAFIVEDLIGQQEIVIKSLGELIGEVKGIAGAAVLGNGQVALILDNSTLLR